MKMHTETIHKITIPTPFLVGPVNVYLICGEVLTLVDTGPLTKEGEKTLIEQLKALGYQLADIDQVVLTHHHPDHVGLAGLFHSSVLIGHRYLRPWLQKDKSFFDQHRKFFQEFYREHGVPGETIQKVLHASSVYMSYIEPTDLDVIVMHGDQLPGHPDWTVLEVPGHAQNHIMLIREQDQLAIGADVLIGTISSNALLEAPMEEGAERPKTLLQYRKSLELMKSLGVSSVLPGHGETINEVDQLIDKRLKGHLDRAQLIKQILSTNRWSAHEISYQLFKEKHVKQPELTFSETFGHLDLLLERNEVKMSKEDGIFIFYNE
ncbi:MBL fold metallo-hydrolase [Halalkalibacter akibai]|uniref:Zn-dependent hydrolases n=1 Tax=Halalkalibacter akibai (strain ATCC 43226 / DSM 21942 / CIP 109018 / JCM 9157 / 1139) TaxID=1236973 RepID=W4QWH1_HALA3|nr:MBL fold metallo-hydrolase [Halalkalibacter akibai]GAE36426.1 Zn-dependent hydrolases [Halalkalibacter akibai JCM 9157]